MSKRKVKFPTGGASIAAEMMAVQDYCTQCCAALDRLAASCQGCNCSPIGSAAVLGDTMPSDGEHSISVPSPTAEDKTNGKT